MNKSRSIQDTFIVIMRITVTQALIMFIMTSLVSAAELNGQGILDRKVSIDANDKEIRSILNEIEKQASVTFTYRPTIIQSSKKVSLHVNEAKISDVLTDLFGSKVEAIIVDDEILLQPSNKTSQEENASEEKFDTEVAFKVSGKIKDENGELLPGVNVIEKGTTTGTVSDADGRYALDVSDENAVLVFSFIGYETQEIPVANQTMIDVTLTTDIKTLGEVVVVGYGTQKKKDITGAVSVVNSEAFVNQAVPNIGNALQGKITGVQITNNGAPGTTPQIRIRGVGSVTDGVNPLFVVDDVIVSDISYLGPNDIESVTVLKDASSAAIYGVRAANGVILITTKSGKKNERLTVSYNAYMGYKEPSHMLKMSNGSQYVDLYNEKMEYLGYPDKKISFADYGNTSTDWYDEILAGSFTQSHDLNLHGGTSNTSFNMGVNYLKDDGFVKTNPYDRVSLKANYDFDISKYVRTGLKLVLTGNKSQGYYGDLLNLTYRALPIFSPKDENGEYVNPNIYSLTGQATNPAATLDYYNSWQNTYNGIGNIYLEVKPIESLSVKTSLGVNANGISYVQYDPEYYVSDFQKNTTNNMTKSRTRSTNLFWDNTVTFDKTFNDHHLTVLGGYSYQLQTSDYFSATASGLEELPSITQSYLFLSMPKIDDVYSQSISDSGSKTVTISYLSRINYSYKDKYMMTFTLRADGSSKFPKQNRWGYFPSIGLGWEMTQEPFLQNIKGLDYLKLRGSYGLLGNNNIPSNIYSPTITTDAYVGVVFGTQQNSGDGIVSYPGTVTQIFNSDLQWEVVKEWDAGIDAELLNNRLLLTLDYYYKKTTNAIFPVTDIGSAGLSSTGVWGNYADILNTGIEVSLGWKGTKKNLSYSFSGNVTYNHNELAAINNGGKKGIYGQYSDTDIITYSTVGEPIGAFYGYKAIGVFQNADEINTKPHLDGAQAGDLVFQDTNKDGIIDASDRTFIGNPNVPFFYGLSATVGYKNFDLLLNMQGVLGNDIFNVNRMYRFGNENWDQDFYEHRWHGEGTSNSYPSAVMANPTTPSSFYVEKGNYLRIKTVQIGYSLPQGISQKAGLSRARVYANLENAFTFFKYNGFSPEVASGSPTLTGTDRNVYPLSSVYTIGFNLTF